ncbi:MAG: cholesterol oxidase substrate-binding domain-containing protein [Myxococcota bacterium]
MIEDARTSEAEADRTTTIPTGGAPTAAATRGDEPREGAPLSRRRFLASTAACAAAAVWTPVFRVRAANAGSGCAVPPGFPSGIPLYQQAFENWSGEIAIDDLWTCEPSTPAQVAQLANWAASQGFTLRARGFMHNWSPIHVTSDTTCNTRVVLLDMTSHFASMSVSSTSPPTVTVQAGASMESLLAFLEGRGYGITSCPAPGDLTVGGVLAIDGHGTAVPANGESRKTGQTYGSFSNRVLSLRAVVWDGAASQYVVRNVDRGSPDARALLASLGRTIVTEVTLQVEANHNLRCQSWIDIPASEMFAPQGSGGRTFASYVASSGRVEAIWFPFTQKPWLKVWTVRKTKPLFSKKVTAPYNYPFSDNITSDASALLEQILTGSPWLTPAFGQLNYDIVASGIVLTWGFDLWGASKNLLLYIKPTTLRVNANGYAILTRRADIQRVVHEFVQRYQQQLSSYMAQGKYPINGPMEIRVTGLDEPGEVQHASPQPPALSALVERTDHPEWDVAVWLDLLTVPGTPDAGAFYAELEAWMYQNYSGNYAAVRVEWSKGWGYTSAGPWTSAAMIDDIVPESLRIGRPPGQDWDDAITRLDALDPHRVFTNAFLDDLAKR